MLLVSELALGFTSTPKLGERGCITINNLESIHVSDVNGDVVLTCSLRNSIYHLDHIHLGVLFHGDKIFMTRK